MDRQERRQRELFYPTKTRIYFLEKTNTPRANWAPRHREGKRVREVGHARNKIMSTKLMPGLITRR
jgi:hypothetical protein